MKNQGEGNASCQVERVGKEQKGVIVEQPEMCLRVKGIVTILPVLSLFLSGVKST